MKNIIAILFVIGIFLTRAATAQTSSFTYQGKLTDGGTPATGQYDITFRLFDLSNGGTQTGTDVVRENVQAVSGVFTVNLDFGTSPFLSNSGKFLEISVRPGASTGTYTLLSPLQPITSSPYAVQTIRAESAATADTTANFTGNLGGDVTGTQVSTVVNVLQTRPVAATPPAQGQALVWNGSASQWEPGSPATAAGSPNYIQNSGTQQASAAKLDVSGGGIYIRNPDTLVITSGNGACWGITVSNAGVLGAFSTPCP